MDIEDEDDIYAPNEDVSQVASKYPSESNVQVEAGKHEDEEEGEEVEEEDSDSVGRDSKINTIQLLIYCK